MGRLIDADALLNEFNPDSDALIDNILARMRIVKHPTAYDLDKVVEEIEKANQGCCNYCGCDLYSDDVIEIVKHGIVSDDVCEWKYVSDGEIIQNPHTKRLYSNEPRPSIKNIYCNTCGKKIKVVE